jgi:hypothetical protein
LWCLFTNLAFAQILARPELDNQDPVRCFDHVSRDARNALQAYQIVYAPGWKEEVGCHGKVPAPDVDACWPPVLQARPLIEQAAQLYEQARRTSTSQQGQQLIAQGNALIRQAAGFLDQASRCFQPIFARWTQNGGHYVRSQDTGSGTASTEGSGDPFDMNSGAGQGLPGEPRIGQYGRDPECGGTNRRYYDEMYGTAGRVMSADEMGQHASRGEIIRCGACGQNRVICWLKSGATVSRTPPGTPTETPIPPMPPETTPPTSDCETYPQLGSRGPNVPDYKIVCSIPMPGAYDTARGAQYPGEPVRPSRTVTISVSGPRNVTLKTPDGTYFLTRIGPTQGGQEYLSTTNSQDPSTRKIVRQRWHYLFVPRQSGALEYDVYYTQREQANGRGDFRNSLSQVWFPAQTPAR